MEHLSTTPLSSSQIQRWTDQDPTLSKVKRWVLEGWPESPEADQELSSYVKRRFELEVDGGCLLWGCRVIVPSQGRKRALRMLHESHPGIAQMKSLARSYIHVVAGDGQGHRAPSKGMFRLSVYQERPTTSSTPSVDMAGKTLKSCSHRLCWADGGENVVTHDGCTF